MRNCVLKIFILFLCVCSTKCCKQLPLERVVTQLEQIFSIELKVLINFNSANETNGDYRKLLITSDKPLIVFNRLVGTRIPAIHHKQSKNLLVIVWLNEVAPWHDTIKLLDQLLWQLHWTEILFVQQQQTEEDNISHALFQQCWLKGFINVLLWHQGFLYTYQPFPRLNIKQLADVKLYANKNHLKDFQGYTIHVPIRRHTPRCYHYQNRRGQTILAGYWYKLVETFIKHYNGSLHSQYFSEEETLTTEQVFNALKKYRYDFIPNVLYFNEAYASSDVFEIARIVIICSTPIEIPESLYLILAFDLKVWLMCLITFGVLSLLLAGIYKYLQNRWCVHNSCLDALKTLLNIFASKIRQRSVLLFILHVMPLLSGFLLTNFYTCNLSSIRTVKIFQPPLITLQDILKTNQMILDAVIDIDVTINAEPVPDFIKQRLVAPKTYKWFKQMRSNLNVSAYFFTGADDLAEYYLYQQKYLRRSFATALPQALYHRPFFFAMPHRSPFMPHFNRFLLYVRENGLYDKFKKDAKWDGAMSGDIKFFVDSTEDKSLGLDYFLSAFVLLFVGLTCAIIAFLFEVYFRSKKKY